jgi:hypothetical protein
MKARGSKIVMCEVCSDNFTTYNSSAKRFCSRACYNKYHKTKEKHCLHCNTVFHIPGQPYQKYCSRMCYFKGSNPWNKGKTNVQEPYWLNKNRDDETKNKISKSKLGVSYTDLHGYEKAELIKDKIRRSAIERRNTMDPGWRPNYNKSSIPILEAKAVELGITDLMHAENGGEFYIKELGYWVDGYSPAENVVIEYYESFHNQKRRIEYDIKRESQIINFLNCTFIIIHETNEK